MLHADSAACQTAPCLDLSAGKVCHGDLQSSAMLVVVSPASPSQSDASKTHRTILWNRVVYMYSDGVDALLCRFPVKSNGFCLIDLPESWFRLAA